MFAISSSTPATHDTFTPASEFRSGKGENNKKGENKNDCF